MLSNRGKKNIDNKLSTYHFKNDSKIIYAAISWCIKVSWFTQSWRNYFSK